MSLTANEADARFYHMIHELIDSQLKTNRRSQQRDAFVSTQLIAPLYGKSMPHPKDFFEVRCNDLNGNGFSFFLDNAPDFHKLVIAFESPAKTVWVHAEVRHHREVLFYPSSGQIESLDECVRYVEHLEAQAAPHTHEAGIPMTLVGCRFTGRFE